MASTNWESLNQDGMWTHEFVINLDAPKDETNPGRANEIHPCLFIRRIHVSCEVAHKVHSRRLGVSDIHHVVDMSWFKSDAANITRFPREMHTLPDKSALNSN